VEGKPMAEIIARNGNDLTIQVTLKLSGSLLEMENTILDGCNEIGCLATRDVLGCVANISAFFLEFQKY
jgi:hypothetical protein